MTFGAAVNALVQILILTCIYLYIYGIVRGTRSLQILLGAVGVISALWCIAAVCKFDVLLSLLGELPAILATALLVIFQPELRRAFLNLGKGWTSLRSIDERRNAIDIICQAAEAMSKKKTGAIIAIERNTHLREWTEVATRVDAPLTKELLLTIFYPGGPMHDGGVVVNDETVVAARCVFPLSQTELGRGTRHRAALGLSERTDAAIVVVSEETGSISVACEGHFFADLNHEKLPRLLDRIIGDGSLAARLSRAAEEAKGGAQ